MIGNPIRILQTLPTAVVLAGVAIPAQGAIISTTPNVLLFPDSEIPTLDLRHRRWAPPELRSSTLMYGLNETQNIELEEDIWTNNPTEWNEREMMIPAGTSISSHYFFYLPSESPTFIHVTIEFDNEILGVIGRAEELWATNSLLGVENITYSNEYRELDTRYWRGKPVNSNDIGSFNGNTLNMYVNSSNGLDVFRVITKTETVPEPLTVFGAFTAASFGAFFKRKLSSKT